MRVPKLPDIDKDIQAGDLVHYRWWCATQCSWVTDGIPRVVIDTHGGGMATVLMDKGLIKLPMSLLQRVDDSCNFFATIV